MKNLSSDQKQKLFILMGFVGLFIIVGFFALRPKSEDPAVAAPAVSTVAAGNPATAPATVPVASSQAKAAPAAQPTPTTVKTVVSIPAIPAPKARAALAQSRPDPFAPIFWPTPPPELSPTPVPPAVVIPPPPSVTLPSPAPEGAPPSTILVGLPNPRISRYSPLPGPRWVVPAAQSNGSGGGNIPSRSADKRLSGVIIGDSVRAILEIQQGNAAGGGEGGGEGAGTGGAAQVITRVVQPGDEVDGIKILRINREFENGRPVTRMYILEGDQERYVDLRASPTPPTAGTGGEGSEGSGFSGSGSGRGGFGRGPFGGGSSGGFGGGIRPSFP